MNDTIKVDKIVSSIKGSRVEVWSTSKPNFEAPREKMKEILRSKAGRD